MKPKVVVLDDEKEITQLVSSALALDGFDTVQVHRVEELWAAIEGIEVSMFVLDVLLPDGNGLNVAREIRAKSQVGIVMLTGLVDELDQVVGLEVGADDYVAKPFRIREFRARVGAVFRRTQKHTLVQSGAPAEVAVAEPTTPNVQASSDLLYVGDAMLNLAARTFKTAQGEKITLTTSEFDVLATLAQSANHVLSRDQIMNEVKGQEWASYDRVIDGIVSRLRSRLSEHGLDPHIIHTVRGIGYVLSNEN